MKATFKTSRKLLSVLLVLCMMATFIIAICVSVGAEAALPDEGRSFDATDDLALAKRLDAQPLTYEAVFYAPSSIRRSGVIFGNYYDSSNSCINFEIHNDGVPSVFLRDSDGNTMDMKFTKVDVRTDEWVHLVITHEMNADGAVFNCYVNGELVDTITTALDYELDMEDIQFTNALALGRDSRSGNAQYFKGKIRNVALYSDVLTAEEIKASYENGVNTENADLMAYYQLDNTEGADSIKDSTDNGYDLHARFYPNQDPLASDEYDYSFAVLGDTQKHVYRDAYKGTNTTDYIYNWLIANKDAKKIQYVIGLGDITDKNGKDNTSDDGIDQTNIEWNIAVEQHEKLTAAGLPYSIIQGNHDTVAQLDKFFAGNENFTNSDIGYYTGNSLGNYYVKFTAGNEKYMIVGLQYGPTDDIIAWAGEAIKNNPDYNVIITTHAYMKKDATTIDMFYSGTLSRKPTTANSTANNGNQIWSDLASQYENVIMVLSGHIPCADIKVRQDVGVNGNTVTQFLIDPQGMDPIYDNKTGMVAMFYFSGGGKTIRVEYVSTYVSTEANDGRDYIYNADANQFTFTIPETVEPTDVVCEYGVIEARYSNPITYPFVVFKTDKTFIGGYSELSDAINAVENNGDYVIYMRKDAELRDMPEVITDLSGSLTVDLGGNSLLKATDGVIFSVNSNVNGGKFIIKNGTVLKYGADPIATVGSNAELAESYSVYFEFDGVTFIDKNGGSNNIFASANGNGAAIYSYATFNNCTFDYVSSTTAPAMINLSGANVIWDVQINGGAILAESAISYDAFVALDTDDNITFGKGENGKYITLQLPESSTVTAIGTMWQVGDGYMGFVAEGNNAFEIKPLEGYVTKYGVVPEEYLDADKYPILMFKDGVFVNGYSKFLSSSSGSTGDAFYHAKCQIDGNNDGEIGSTVQLLFRADVVMTSYYANAGQSQGTIIVDLDGHKLIQGFTNYPIVYALAKNWNGYGIEDATFKFINGEMVLTTELIYMGSNDGKYNSSATDTDYKTIHIPFENVKFTYAEGTTATTFLARHYDGSNMKDGKKLGYNVTFTDCTFDFTNATSMDKIFNAKDNAITRCSNIVTVEVNGCEMITQTPPDTLYEIQEENGSSVTFGEGADGKYLKITALDGGEMAGVSANGGDLELVKVGEGVYELTPAGLMTEYGFVPKEYLDATKYPILMFRNGEFVGGYSEYVTSSGGTKNVDALYVAKCYIDGNAEGEIGSSVQLLFMADVTVSTSYSNIGQAQGTIVLDLNGHKLIQNYTNQPFFYTQAKEWDSYGIGDLTFEIRNGEMVLKTELAFFGATGAAYNSKATDTEYKTTHFTFDGVKFSYAEDAIATVFLGKFHDGSSISGGKKVGYELTFNGCTFDFTNATAIANFLNAKDGSTSKCNSIVNVSVNGCEMITGDPAIKLYEVHASNGSSVTFGKGADGKYLKMTVIGSDEAPTATGNNGELKFVKVGEVDGNAVYEFTSHVHSYNEAVTAPTFTYKGYTTYTC